MQLVCHRHAASDWFINSYTAIYYYMSCLFLYVHEAILRSLFMSADYEDGTCFQTADIVQVGHVTIALNAYISRSHSLYDSGKRLGLG